MKIHVPIDDFKQCHLKFLFKHRSSNEQKDRAEKPFGMSYIKLMQNNGTTIMVIIDLSITNQAIIN